MELKLKGRAHKLPIDDNINTDYIISGRRKFTIQDQKELAKYIFEDLTSDFHLRLNCGDMICAGKNFGCGSSREQAPLALKAAGIGAIIAKSFARIFYRNSINVGLPLVECDASSIDDGDEIELDIESDKLRDLTKGIDIEIKPVSPIMKRLITDGGAISHIKRYGGFKFEL